VELKSFGKRRGKRFDEVRLPAGSPNDDNAARVMEFFGSNVNF